MGPLAIAGMGAGASLMNALFGGGQQGIPQEIIDMILKEFQGINAADFLPEQGIYEEQIGADIENIMSQLPVNEEAFMARLATQGLYGSGELPKYMYRDVYAPLARAATTASVRGRMGYAEAYQQSKFQAQQQRSNLLQMLIDAVMGKEPSMMQRLGGWMGEAGGLGMKYGLGKELGLFG